MWQVNEWSLTVEHYWSAGVYQGSLFACSPRTFEIEATKYGRARVISQTADLPEDIQIAMEVRYFGCILCNHLLRSKFAITTFGCNCWFTVYAGVPCQLYLL
jgi:hypothetical protein